MLMSLEVREVEIKMFYPYLTIQILNILLLVSGFIPKELGSHRSILTTSKKTEKSTVLLGSMREEDTEKTMPPRLER